MSGMTDDLQRQQDEHIKGLMNLLKLPQIGPFEGLTSDTDMQIGKFIDKQNERIEILENALKELIAWSEAYPIGAFPEPDFDYVKQKLGDTLLSLVSASNMRHVITGIKDTAKKALEKSWKCGS